MDDKIVLLLTYVFLTIIKIDLAIIVLAAALYASYQAAKAVVWTVRWPFNAVAIKNRYVLLLDKEESELNAIQKYQTNGRLRVEKEETGKTITFEAFRLQKRTKEIKERLFAISPYDPVSLWRWNNEVRKTMAEIECLKGKAYEHAPIRAFVAIQKYLGKRKTQPTTT